ncbi:MAG: hypothetical protein AB7V43_16650, partial [Acidimicrobiia bacterium]
MRMVTRSDDLGRWADGQIGMVCTPETEALVRRAAESIGVEDQVHVRTHTRTPDVIEPSLQLDRLCDVILFPGRIPHHIAMTSGHRFRAELRYVPESSNDLYRTLFDLAVVTDRPAPRISVDHFSRSLVTEVFEDLRLPAPTDILEIDEIPGEWEEVNRIVADFHLDAFRAGRADGCLSGLFATAREVRVQ